MLQELQRRNYSAGTIRLYLQQVAAFAQHFHRPPDQLGVEEIRQYQLFRIQQKKLAWSSYNQIVCALRFFYAKTLKRPVAAVRHFLPLVLFHARRQARDGRRQSVEQSVSVRLTDMVTGLYTNTTTKTKTGSTSTEATVGPFRGRRSGKPSTLIFLAEWRQHC